MAQSVKPDPIGDTPKQIEDKVRALPANQGLNEYEMWQKIDTEITEATSAGKLRNTERYTNGPSTGNKYGRK